MTWLMPFVQIRDAPSTINLHGGKHTCLHLFHTVEEVVRGAGDTVTADAQSAVCALIPGVVGATTERHTNVFKEDSKDGMANAGSQEQLTVMPRDDMET